LSLAAWAAGTEEHAVSCSRLKSKKGVTQVSGLVSICISTPESPKLWRKIGAL
jgi:hypothetical protein